MNIPRRLAAMLFCAFCVCATSRSIAQEKVDLDAITRIRYEGFHDSKIMEIASGLMDEIGERLTGSPNMKRANDWTRDKLTEFGLTNSHLEPWSPFGRGWANEYVNVRMVSPDVTPLLAYAKAWTPGTNGTVTGKVVRVNIPAHSRHGAGYGEVFRGRDWQAKSLSLEKFRRSSLLLSR